MSPRRTRALVLLLALLGPGAALASPGQEEVLTNESVVAMTKAGLSADVIVAKIRASESRFDVSSDQLIALKQESVPDAVIEAMIEAAGAAPAPPEQPPTRLRRVTAGPGGAQPAAALPANVAAVYPPGIYYFVDRSPAEPELVPLEPAVYTQSKAVGAWKTRLSKGVLKTKYKAVLPGAHANLQVDGAQPVFYFVFDVTGSSPSYSGGGWTGLATSANEFLLVRLDVEADRREIVVGEYGEYTGSKSGTPSEYVQPFEFRRVEPGVYAVSPKKPLAPGEYGFYYGGSVGQLASGHTGGPKVFDFGVKKPAAPAP